MAKSVDDFNAIVHAATEQKRWPAGSPNGKGGQWMPMDEFNELSNEAQIDAVGRAARAANYKKSLADLTPKPPATTAESLMAISKAAYGAKIQNPPKGKTIRNTYPELTEEELNRRIRRIQLEQTYSDLKGDTKYIKSGSEKFNDALQNVGAVSAVAASAAIVVGAIAKAMKNNKSSKK